MRKTLFNENDRHKTIAGLHFENKDNFLTLLQKIPFYTIRPSLTVGTDILFKGEFCATCFKENQFYEFLESKEINWQNYISERLLPGDAILIILRETLFIIEVKYQQVSSSIYEKLQTCDFKRKQYVKLISPLNLRVEYVYVLNDGFKDPEYKDVLDYIHSVNCHYKFNELPLAWLGLPTKEAT